MHSRRLIRASDYGEKWRRDRDKALSRLRADPASVNRAGGDLGDLRAIVFGTPFSDGSQNLVDFYLGPSDVI